MKVELIYDRNCPNVDGAREVLLRALVETDRSPRSTEWERAAPDCPSYVRGYGSPTILVDGCDISPGGPNGDSCRLYAQATGELCGVPPVDGIVDALTHEAHRSGFGGLLAALPTSGAFLLPMGACPACWPAYAACLGPLGLGFLLSEHTLLPVAAVLLILTLGSVAYRASTRRGYGPFCLGLAGAASAVVGKFLLSADPVLYLGLVVILAAAVWNAWPSRHVASCASCASPQPEPQEEPSQ